MNLQRLDAALRLGLKLFVCDDEKCQSPVQQKHCIMMKIMGDERQIFCSMKCAYALAKDFDGLFTIFTPLPEHPWLILGKRSAMSEDFVLTTAGLALLEQEDGRG